MSPIPHASHVLGKLEINAMMTQGFKVFLLESAWAKTLMKNYQQNKNHIFLKKFRFDIYNFKPFSKSELPIWFLCVQINARPNILCMDSGYESESSKVPF